MKQITPSGSISKGSSSDLNEWPYVMIICPISSSIMPEREGARKWHQRERGGQRLAPEREGARNWHHREGGPETCPQDRGGRIWQWREMGQETGNRERRGQRHALRERGKKLALERDGKERGRKSLFA